MPKTGLFNPDDEILTRNMYRVGYSQFNEEQTIHQSYCSQAINYDVL